MKYVVGIDPGMKGGIAKLAANGTAVSVIKMPDTPKDIYDTLCELVDANTIVYLEDVGQGMPGQSSSATAKFARHNGHLEMALIAIHVPYIKVKPQKWERTYSLGASSKFTKNEWKNRLKQRAQELFPNIKITLANCDALLIAEYGRQNTETDYYNFINTNTK